jgi:ElaB/YqjD/DUF883 family membrane-anchored ribosome-binding protein
MATLEDAAEQLVVKLRGLDSEIEESEDKLEDLRGRVDEAAREVDQEWTALREAASSLLEKVREEQEQLRDQVEQTAQAMVDAQSAVAEQGAESREELGEGRARLEALGQHATGLQPGVESLASEAGEAPARSLAERARELEQELHTLLEEARDFLQEDVVASANDAADEIRQVCETLHQSLAAAAASSFQQAYDDWESQIGKLEDYVVSEGYAASHEHARAVVGYAVEACDQACNQDIDDVQQLVGALQTQLKELSDEVEQSADRVVAQTGAQLVQELESTRRSAIAALEALDGVKRQLAQYSFVEV